MAIYYDEQESNNNAMACSQIEADMRDQATRLNLAKAQLESDLYCIGMESEIAYKRMPAICQAMGVKFPPQKQGVTA